MDLQYKYIYNHNINTLIYWVVKTGYKQNKIFACLKHHYIFNLINNSVMKMDYRTC